MRFESEHGSLKVEGQVEIERPAVTLPELGLLMVLGWYLLVMCAQDATSDAVAATAAAAGS